MKIIEIHTEDAFYCFKPDLVGAEVLVAVFSPSSVGEGYKQGYCFLQINSEDDPTPFYFHAVRVGE